MKLPAEVFAHHSAVVGKTGSGKTSTAKLMVEHVVAAGSRVCVLDPIKSDWWGMISSADGKKPGLPFYVLGGPHGHVPLHESSGAAIGELVAKGDLPLSIIDMADFKPGGLQKFFIDFAAALHKHMRGVVYLVVEEAHEFAPKERAGMGNENLALHWAKKLATAGRSKGIRLILATQRTQSLHNALLGSCETVIVHRLTLPADQKPVLDWLKANMDRPTVDQVAASLASLPTGTGWVCSGEAQIGKRIAFPRITTYDNSATPTGDGAGQDVKTAAVDQDKLRAIIGDAVKEAEANDPKALRKRIAELERQVGQQAPAGASKEELDAAYGLGRLEAEADRDRTWKGALQSFEAEVRIHLAGVETVFARFQEAYRYKIDDGNHPAASGARAAFERAKAAAPVPGRNVRPTPALTAKPTHGHTRLALPAGAPSDLLPGGQQGMLNAIGWWRKIGIEPVSKDRACVAAGISPTSSTGRAHFAKLQASGLIDVPQQGMVQLTAEGLQQAVIPTATSQSDLREMARSLLRENPLRVFDLVYEAYPQPVTRHDVAVSLGASPTSSTIRAWIAAVTKLGIIVPNGAGEVIAADWLFP